MLKEVMYVLLVVLGFFAGFIILKLCKDEVKKWRKRFLFIFAALFLFMVIVYFLEFEYKTSVILALAFSMAYCLPIIFWRLK